MTTTRTLETSEADIVYDVHGPLPTAFLAGGISGCPDWQREVEGLVPEDVVLVSPRLVSFDFTDPQAAARQVRWERARLREATFVLFWFPEPACLATTQPISLLELGRYACATSRPVAASRSYIRREDVVLQLEDRPDVVVRDSLAETCADLSALVRQLRRVA